MKHVVAVGKALKKTANFEKGETLEVIINNVEVVEVVIKRSIFLSHDDLQRQVLKGNIFLIEYE